MEEYSESKRDWLMLAGLYLDEEAIARNSDILSELPEEEFPVLSEEGLAELADDRKQETCSSFVRDNGGFTAEITLEEENLVFFSVPWDKGWSATVNGEPVEIEKANAGFMAVRVPAGSAEIRFDYKTPGLAAGGLITLGAALLLGGYFVIVRIAVKRNPALRCDPYRHLNAEPACENVEASRAYSRSVAAKIRAKVLDKKGKGEEE